MMAVNRDALICDLAETYGILDCQALPALLLATLSCGLRADSRIVHFLQMNDTATQKEMVTFDSPEEFEAAKAAILGGGYHSD